MRRLFRLPLLGTLAIAAVAGLATLFLVPSVGANQGAEGAIAARTYTITVENLTDGQILTPPVFAMHNRRYDMFEVGDPASYGIKEISENGNLEPMLFALSHQIVGLKEAGVASGAGADGSGPIPAGTTRTFTFETDRGGNRFSAAAMVVCTNDGFTGLDSVRLPYRIGRTTTIMAHAYDAGTEMNTENFDDLVPPCSGGTTGTPLSNPALAEGGVIAMHDGITGTGDLDPGVWGFDGSVARFTITRTS